MRIGLLSFEYPPETGFGGIGTYTWTQARALARLGHEVHVVAGATDASPVASSWQDGVRVWRGRAPGPTRATMGRAAGWLRLWWTRRRLLTALDTRHTLARVLAEGALDAVEIPECGAEGLLCRNLLPGRAVVRFHSPAELILPYYAVNTLDRALATRLERRALGGAAAYTSPTRFLAAAARARFGIQGSIDVVPNGIDLAAFPPRDPGAAAAALDLPPGRLRVLFAGRLERRKGIDVAATVCERLLARPEVDFVFAGEDLFGEFRQRLEPRFASHGGGRVRALGRLGRIELARWLAAADVVLLPSRWENAPYALLEAMASAAAIVSTAVGGIPEILRDGSEGILVPAGDANATYAATARLLDAPELARTLGRAARARVERDFAAEPMARRSLELYGAIADRRKDA